jgi:hypothetical protein
MQPHKQANSDHVYETVRESGSCLCWSPDTFFFSPCGSCSNKTGRQQGSAQLCAWSPTISGPEEGRHHCGPGTAKLPYHHVTSLGNQVKLFFPVVKMPKGLNRLRCCYQARAVFTVHLSSYWDAVRLTDSQPHQQATLSNLSQHTCQASFLCSHSQSRCSYLSNRGTLYKGPPPWVPELAYLCGLSQSPKRC